MLDRSRVLLGFLRFQSVAANIRLTKALEKYSSVLLQVNATPKRENAMIIRGRTSCCCYSCLSQYKAVLVCFACASGERACHICRVDRYVVNR